VLSAAITSAIARCRSAPPMKTTPAKWTSTHSVVRHLMLSTIILVVVA